MKTRGIELLASTLSDNIDNLFGKKGEHAKDEVDFFWSNNSCVNVKKMTKK